MKKLLIILGVFVSYISYGQPGSTCGNPLTVGALPYTNTGASSCGFGDDYDDGDACGSFYMTGDDIVFEYTATFDGTIDVALTNTSASGGGSPWSGLFILDGCPTAMGATCLSTSTAISGDLSATASVTNGDTYYVIVSSFPSPQCIDFDIAISRGPDPGVTCYTQSSPAYTAISVSGSSQITPPDDSHGTLDNIGFNFCFMGQEYTQLVASSNGYITFRAANANAYSSWVTESIPSTLDDVMASILGPWHDLDATAAGSGEVRQRVIGSAPNRQYEVTWNNIHLYDCEDVLQRHTIIIYETSNVIDIKIQEKTICGTWNSGNATMGLNGPLGVNAVTVGGRNNSNWTASNEVTRFTPTCNVCTTVLDGSEEFSYFDVTNFGARNEIIWGTSKEEDVVHFEVQRSSDAVKYETITKVKSKFGNSKKESAYSYIDRKPNSGINYYRVKRINSNGEWNFTTFKSVEVGLEFVPKVYPNPTKGLLFVEYENVFNSTDAFIQILDLMGRELLKTDLSISTGFNQTKINVSELEKGSYIYRVYVNDEMDSGRIVIE